MNLNRRGHDVEYKNPPIMTLRARTVSRRSVANRVRYVMAECIPNGHDPLAWLGTSFLPPPDVEPTELFKPQWVCPVYHPNGLVFVQRFCFASAFMRDFVHTMTMAIYTGSAGFESNSEEADANADPHKTSVGFTFSPLELGKVYCFWEDVGADGQLHQKTRDRAEMQAVLAALGYRDWVGEGWDRIVIITKSEYLGKNVTQNMLKWAADGWPDGSEGAPNRDLWELLSDVLGDYAKRGCEVSFWIK